MDIHYNNSVTDSTVSGMLMLEYRNRKSCRTEIPPLNNFDEDSDICVDEFFSVFRNSDCSGTPNTLFITMYSYYANIKKLSITSDNVIWG